MTLPEPHAPTVLFVAAFDSQLKWCATLRDELVARGFGWRVVAPDVRSALSPDQIAAAGFDHVETLAWTELLEVARGSAVLVSALSGPLTQGLLLDLADSRSAAGDAGPGPVVVTGWVGVIIEKITAGYLDRCAADVVAVNSRADLAHFTDVAGRLDLPTANLCLSGLPILGAQAAPPRRGPIRTVLFADQPTVPQQADERRYVYERLVDYARAHPDREVVLKPRHRPEEDTFHRMLHHPERLLAGTDLPPNLRIDYTPVAEQLPTTDLLLTMSSTACLEAVHAGCRVALVGDLGVHERYGNHVLLESGLLRTFGQIVADDLGEPDPTWCASYFLDQGRSPAAMVADRVTELLAGGERPGEAVRRTRYYRGAAEFQRSVLAPRRQRTGPATRRTRGTAARVGHALLPPVLIAPLRRMAQHVGVR